MDEQLIEQLRKLSLLPLDLDTERQAYWKEQGIDWRNFETHNPPTISPTIAKTLCPSATSQKLKLENMREQIEQDVRALYKLEEEGQGESEKYQRLETQIQEQLQELPKPQVGLVAAIASEALNSTGTGGYVRDHRATL